MCTIHLELSWNPVLDMMKWLSWDEPREMPYCSPANCHYIVVLKITNEIY